MSKTKCYRLDIYNTDILHIFDSVGLINNILNKYKCLCVKPDNAKNMVQCFFTNIDDRYEAFMELEANNIDCRLIPLTALIDKKEEIKSL